MKKTIFIIILLGIIFQYSFSVPDYSGSIIQKIEYSKDNKYFIAMTRDNVSLFDAKEYKLKLQKKSTAATLSPDSLYLAFADNNGKIILWSLEENLIKSEIKLQGDSNWIFTITFSSDGKYIACGGFKSEIYIISTANTQIIKTIKTDYKINYLSYYDNDKYLISSDFFQTISIWDTKNYISKNKISVKPAYLGYSILGFSQDGKYYLSANSPNIGVLRKIDSNQDLSTFSGLTKKPVLFSSDNKFVLAGLTNGTIKIFDTNTGKELKTIGDAINTSVSHSGCSSSSETYRQSLSHHVTSLSISNNNQTFITGHFFNSFSIWNLKKSKIIKSINIPYIN